MGKKRRPFARKTILKSGGASTDTLTESAPPPGSRRTYTQITAWDDTSAVTSVQFVSGPDGRETEFHYVPNLQADERAIYDASHIVLTDRDALNVVFTGATSGDTLTLITRGWEEDL